MSTELSEKEQALLESAVKDIQYALAAVEGVLAGGPRTSLQAARDDLEVAVATVEDVRWG